MTHFSHCSFILNFNKPASVLRLQLHTFAIWDISASSWDPVGQMGHPSLFSMKKNIFRLSSKLQILSLRTEYLLNATWYKLKQASRKPHLTIAEEKDTKSLMNINKQHASCNNWPANALNHSRNHISSHLCFFLFVPKMQSWLAFWLERQFDQAQQWGAINSKTLIFFHSRRTHRHKDSPSPASQQHADFKSFSNSSLN